MSDILDGVSRLLLDNHFISVMTILLVSYIAAKLLVFSSSKLIRRTVRTAHFKTTHDEKQREETIIGIATTALQVVIVVIAGLMIAGSFGVNIGPILAGASVAGVALGFGAQSMVKNYLAGVFIVAENQYRVGDVVRINQEVSGVVEHMSLRATVLRDMDGIVHYIPNGFIDIASNMTMDHAKINLDITVGYETDIDKLEVLINAVGKGIAEDEAWEKKVIESPYMLRVENFAESGIVVKIAAKTAPMEQWAVKSEILRRLKKRFEKEKIDLPYPQLVVHQVVRKKI
jgi:moderate conductance mechanosensitive channel